MYQHQHKIYRRKAKMGKRMIRTQGKPGSPSPSSRGWHPACLLKADRGTQGTGFCLTTKEGGSVSDGHNQDGHVRGGLRDGWGADLATPLRLMYCEWYRYTSRNRPSDSSPEKRLEMAVRGMNGSTVSARREPSSIPGRGRRGQVELGWLGTHGRQRTRPRSSSRVPLRAF